MSQDDEIANPTGHELWRRMAAEVEIELKRIWPAKYDISSLESQHSKLAGAKNEISMQFQEAPNTENYLRLRREHPDALIEIATGHQHRWLARNHEELNRFGINKLLVVGALGGDLDFIGELSLQLLEKLLERKQLMQTGENQVQSRGSGIRDSLVHYLIAAMLESLDRANLLHVPRDLMMLIRQTLGSDVTREEGEIRIFANVQNALWEAAISRELGHPSSMNAIAKLLGVNRSTVSRWFPNSDFDERVDKTMELRREMQIPPGSREPSLAI